MGLTFYSTNEIRMLVEYHKMLGNAEYLSLYVAKSSMGRVLRMKYRQFTSTQQRYRQKV